MVYVTKTELAADDGASLVGFKQSDANAVAMTVQDKCRERLSVEDFKDPADPDHTAAFTKFIAALNDPDGHRHGVIPAGSYDLDSSLLEVTPLVITRNGVSISGDGLPEITIVGTAKVTAFLKFANCAGSVDGIKVIGNNRADNSFANGLAIRQELSAVAVADVEGMRVSNCVFDNFQGPFWVYVLNRHTTFRISGGAITRNRFVSRSGNSLNPALTGQSADAICIYGEEGSAGVHDFEISNNAIHAAYIKAGVRLFHVVSNVRVSGNIVSNAGQYGAQNNRGAYAYMAYAENDEASDISFVNNTALNARSIGLYIRGGIVRIDVDGFVANKTLDNDFSDLPKGGVVVNGALDFTVRNVVTRDSAGYAVCIVPNQQADIQLADVRGITAYNCHAAVWVGAAYRSIPDLKISDVNARECFHGIVAALYDQVAFSAEISNVRIKSAKSDSRGIEIFAQQTDRLVESLLLENIFVDTASIGIDVRALPNTTLRNIETFGNFSTGGIYLDNCTKLAVDGVLLRGMSAGGFAWSAALAEGILRNVQFIDVNAAVAIRIFGTDLGINVPTWTGGFGQYVQKLNATSGDAEGWTWTSGTTWKSTGSIAT